MATTYYAIFYTDSGSPKTGLTPAADAYYNMSTAAAIASAAAFTVAELGSGLYQVSVNWDHADLTNVTKVGLRIDSGDATMSDSERYIGLEADKHDAQDLTELATVLDTLIEDWTITNNQLIIKDRNGATAYTFNLKDADGAATSTNPASRERV